jgi:hypothetical protein
MTNVPPPDQSPSQADVRAVVPHQLITAEWGTSVAADLSELWAAVADLEAGGGAPGPAGPAGPAGAAGPGVAAGGTTGQVLNKTSGTDYATGWATLTKTSVGLGNVDNTSDATQDAAATTLTNKTLTSPIITEAENAQTGTTYTLVLADQSKMVTLTNAAAITVTVPTNAAVAYPVGTCIDIAQYGAGQVTVAAAGGVTVNGTPGLKLRAQYSGATLWKRATDVWLLMGDLAP